MAATGLTPQESVAVVMVTLSALFLIACGIFTVIARTFLHNYYLGAHIAILAIFVSIFVISHHVFKVRQLLNHQRKTFALLQCVLNFWYLLCCFVMAIGYSALAHMAIHTNYDYVSALILSWCNMGLMTYLCVMICHRMWTEKMCGKSAGRTESQDIPRESPQARSEVRMNTFHGMLNDNGSQELSDGTLSDDSHATLVRDPTSSKLKICCQFFIRFLYYFCQFLLMLTFLLSAYHPCCVVDDTLRFREDASMVTVTVPGHRPLAFFVKCAGSGNETLLFENGLGGMVYMGWSFIPKNLSQTYRVCAYDRRGYGWSEGIEQDYPNAVLLEPQWAGSNVYFLEKLIEATPIPTPFYYIGHSYGGYHMTLLALRRPDVIKGLVFLDSARFSPLATLRALMSLMANLHATGLLRLSLDLKILNYRKLFSSVVDFSGISPVEEERLMSIFRSGNFFSTYMREGWPLTSPRYAYNKLHEELQNKTINKPVIVIDAGDRSGGEWLSGTHFPQYNSNFYHTVNGTDHQSLIYSTEHSWKTKILIEEFIQNVTKQTNP